MESTSENVLATRLVKDYDLPETAGMHWGHSFIINPNRPRFSRAFIPFMKRDPRIRLGIAVKKGPIIQNTQFQVEASSPEVADWISAQLEIFRLNGLDSALDSFWWGWSSHEIMYERDFQGNWEYAGLERIDVADSRLVHKDGVLLGMNVYRVYNPTVGNKYTYVPLPKCLWNVHQKAEHKWFGLPAVWGCFEPWWETWCQKGFRDTRSLWFFKNAFSGPTVYYPTGSTPVAQRDDGSPVMRSNKEIADELHDKLQTGAGVTVPSSPNENAGNWRVERGESNPIPDGLIQYGVDLANEKLEGMGVFPEIVSADGAGAYSGRSIPMQGFMSIAQTDASEAFSAFCFCCLKPMVKFRWGVNAGFRVLVKGLYEATPYANDIDDPNQMDSIDSEGGDDFKSDKGNGSPYDRPNGKKSTQQPKQPPGTRSIPR